MQKRAQVTLFMILAVVLVIILGLSYYIAKYNAKSKSSQSIREKTDFTDTSIVKTYAESCLKSVSEDALFNRIGLHGGYVNSNSVPYYLEASCTESRCSFKEDIPEANKITAKTLKNIVIFLLNLNSDF